MLAALAKRAAAKVLTSDLYPERHAVAATFGLDSPIDASREDVVGVVRAATEGRGADAVILAVGGNALIRTAMDAARPGGRVLLFAQTQHGEATIDPAAVCVDEKTLWVPIAPRWTSRTRRCAWFSRAMARDMT